MKWIKYVLMFMIFSLLYSCCTEPQIVYLEPDPPILPVKVESAVVDTYDYSTLLSEVYTEGMDEDIKKNFIIEVSKASRLDLILLYTYTVQEIKHKLYALEVDWITKVISDEEYENKKGELDKALHKMNIAIEQLIGESPTLVE